MRVECYAGYRGEEEPRRFHHGGGRIEVADSRSGATMRVTLPAHGHPVEADLLGDPGAEDPTTR